MPKRPNPTTVVLSKLAQEVKDDLAPVYGLKNILSAGLILFGQLSSKDQKQTIKKANGLIPLVSDGQAAIDDENAAARADAALRYTQKKRKRSKSG